MNRPASFDTGSTDTLTTPRPVNPESPDVQAILDVIGTE
jgi:hypothetical protein